VGVDEVSLNEALATYRKQVEWYVRIHT
jgi:hypothetical protein